MKRDPVREAARQRSIPTISGRYPLVVIFLLGMMGVGVSQWYFTSVQRRPKKLWGDAAVWLIVRGERVSGFELRPLSADVAPTAVESDAPIETMHVGKQRFQVKVRRDVTEAVGMDNLRDALLHDRSYDWAAMDDMGRASERPPVWQFGLTFEHEQHEVTLLFAPAEDRALLVETSTQARLSSGLAEKIASFLKDQLGKRAQ